MIIAFRVDSNCTSKWQSNIQDNHHGQDCYAEDYFADTAGQTKSRNCVGPLQLRRYSALDFEHGAKQLLCDLGCDGSNSCEVLANETENLEAAQLLSAYLPNRFARSEFWTVNQVQSLRLGL
eukprot:3903028-Rhodomonas_salina.1